MLLPLRPRRPFLLPARLAAVPYPLGEFRPFSFRASEHSATGALAGKRERAAGVWPPPPEPAAAAAADTEMTTRRAFVHFF